MPEPSSTPPATMRVLCTAGHVDHGKSTLVDALTGTDPDRLAEEKQRGLTIDLGFAWTRLPDVGDVVFVDLPGHERFVPNMLAGSGSIRTALFVVAADEGWMPQSAEHLAILELLGVRDGIVALTKVDRVDAETCEIATELVRDELVGTGLADAPVIPVSAVTGAGLDELRGALSSLLSALPPPPDNVRPRMWIDRRFSVAGVGTVITGTLTGGALTSGDKVHVWPLGQEVRIRGIQCLEKPVDSVGPGARVALNLVGVDTDDVPRGSMIGIRSHWAATDTLDGWCRPADVAGTGAAVLGRRGAWTLHTGTAAVPAALFPTAGTDLDGPGGVRIKLDHPLPLAAGDRFVLREAGRSTTVGGGVVLDPAPPARPRGRLARRRTLAELDSLHQAASPATRLAGLLARHEELPADRALAMAGATVEDLDGSGVTRLGSFLMDPDRWTTLSNLTVESVLGAHQRHPALEVADITVPRTLLQTTGAAADVVEAVIAQAVRDGLLEQLPGGVRVPGHEARLSVAQQSGRTALLAALDDAGVSIPSLRETATRVGADDDLIDALRRDGQLITVGPDLAITTQTRDTALAVLVALQDATGPFTASQARDALATTRKFALPLLEAFDAAGLTRRQGDLRSIR